MSSVRARPRVNIVVAMAENRAIGREGGLPWHLPGDLRRFREVTMGHPLVMGRRTHASIGRVLPGRLNIVIASDPASVAPGCVAVQGFEEAMHAAGAAAELMVVGGAAVYAAALPLCTRLFVTEVHAAVDGDVFFPDFDPRLWRETRREPRVREGDYEYSFVVLERPG